MVRDANFIFESLLSYVRLDMNKWNQLAEADDAAVATQPVKRPGTIESVS